MTAFKEPVLRSYPEYPFLGFNQVQYTESQVGKFSRMIMGMYFEPGLERLHGVIQSLASASIHETVADKSLTNSLIYIFSRHLANLMGLAMPDAPKVRPEQKIFTRDKFPLLVDKSKVWSQTDKPSRHGASIGAYDPPHPFHTLSMRMAYPHTSRLFVGVDPNWLLKERKSKPGDERPRFPYLLYRMWQFACLPMIDAVFELPVEPGERVSDILPSVWRDLNVTLLHTEENHEYLPQYKEEMKAQGGAVLTTRKFHWWGRFLQITSTGNVNRLSHLYFGGTWGPDRWRQIMSEREAKIARRMQKLYPDLRPR